MPEQPQLVRVVRKGGRFSLTFDGNPFPWLVDTVETVMSAELGPTIRLTLPAQRIEVIDEPAPIAINSVKET